MSVFVETIKLDDQVSPAAKKAAGAFDVLSKSLEATEKQLVKATALGNTKGIEKATKDADALRGGLSQLNPELVNQGKSAQFAAQGTEALSADLAATVGVLAAVAAAVAAVVVGFGALVVMGAKFAIEASEAKAASIGLFDALGQGKIAGEEVDDMLDELRATTGLTKDSMAKFTTEFLRMGITGKESLEGLTVAASSAEALVKGGGSAFVDMYGKIDAATASGEKLVIPFKKLTTQLAGMRLNAGDVAKEMGISTEALTKGLEKGTIDSKKFGQALEDAVVKKGAGPMALLANSAKNLGDLLNEYLGDLFEDLGASIAPFMKEVKSLFSILDSKANPSGKALKAGIEAFFKEVFVIAAKVVPMIKHFLLDVIIFGLKAYIAIKPIAKAIKEWSESAEGASTISTVLDTLIGGFKALLVVVGFIVVVAGAFIAVLIGIQIAIVAAGYAVLNFVAQAGAALSGWVAGAATAAYDFISGLVSGIGAGAARVVGAVTGLAKSALNAFTGKDGIDAHSPSLKMIAAGGNMAQGVVVGLDDGAPAVNGSSSALAQSAVASASGGGAQSAPAAASGGGATINVNVQIDGAGKSAGEITQELVANVFQQMALQAGV